MVLLHPAKPWIMCSSYEASERITFKELSPFECTLCTYKKHPRDRVPDPMKCVKKYRRSAAGGGVQSQYKANGTEWKRSLEDLEISVDYLLTVFSNQQSEGMEEKASLIKTVNFVDDRLRAVQVDITTHLGSMSDIDDKIFDKVKGIQVKLVRYNILTQHLFSEMGADVYEWKFTNTALTTAISSFFSACQGQKVKGEECNLDEVMSYAALLHMAMVLKKKEAALPQTSSTGQRCGLASDGGDGMSVILNLYRKHVQKGSNAMKNGSLPRYHWALSIAGAIESDNLLSAMRLLAPKPSEEEKIDDESRWKIIARCCIAQAIPLMRIGIMRRYNKSFGKQEKVRDDDVSPCKQLGTNVGSFWYYPYTSLTLFVS